MSTISEDPVLDRICHKLTVWLESDDYSTRTTEQWLRGLMFPAVGQGDEACMWILRALREAGDARQELESHLADRLVVFLSELPKLEVPPRRAESLYFNLLTLCRGISARDKLFGPLCELRARLVQVAKDYPLTPLTANSLRDALIENQTDNRLRNIWLDMSESTLPDHDKDPVLRGDGEIALHAVRLMPPSHDRQGEPATLEIAIVLRNIAESMPDDAAHRILLKDFMATVLETYPDNELFKNELVREAVEQGWGRSVIESFPGELCQPVPGENALIVWKHHLACFPKTIQRESLCNGVLYKVNIGQHDPRSAQACIMRIEIGRRDCPFPSQGAMAGVAMQALQDLIIDQESSTEARETAQKAQNAIAEEQAIPIKKAVS